MAAGNIVAIRFLAARKLQFLISSAG
jgi:hypothetical protein